MRVFVAKLTVTCPQERQEAIKKDAFSSIQFSDVPTEMGRQAFTEDRSLLPTLGTRDKLVSNKPHTELQELFITLEAHVLKR